MLGALASAPFVLLIARDLVGHPYRPPPFRGDAHAGRGRPLAVISEWLGHAGIAITAAHYAAVVPVLRREAAAAIDRALA